MRRSLPLLVAAALLASCAGPGGSVVYTPTLTKYRAGVAEWAAAPNAELLTEIHGTPFGPDVSPDAVAKAVPIPGWVAKRLTITPSPGTPKDYRLVLNFGPAYLGDGGDAVCATPSTVPLQPVAVGAPMPVTATYCIFNEAMTAVRGISPAATTPDDKNFQQFVYVMLSQILPIMDPNVRGFCSQPTC